MRFLEDFSYFEMMSASGEISLSTGNNEPIGNSDNVRHQYSVEVRRVLSDETFSKPKEETQVRHNPATELITVLTTSFYQRCGVHGRRTLWQQLVALLDWVILFDHS